MSGAVLRFTTSRWEGEGQAGRTRPSATCTRDLGGRHVVTQPITTQTALQTPLCLPACLPACLPVCLSSFFLACFLACFSVYALRVRSKIRGACRTNSKDVGAAWGSTGAVSDDRKNPACEGRSGLPGRARLHTSSTAVCALPTDPPPLLVPHAARLNPPGDEKIGYSSTRPPSPPVPSLSHPPPPAGFLSALPCHSLTHPNSSLHIPTLESYN
ncbi:hypothetical protein O3P69_002716 [Scylla paramamosain]|uniref:Uncharacterized protein n=1 Tax=Scylla paramamosain TaxID=85552 RepID=A0AAW0UQV6_SCYPA